MKKFLINGAAAILLILSFSVVKAQPWMNAVTDRNNPNFFEIQKAFYDYWNAKGIDVTKKSPKEDEDDGMAGYNQFKRWEWFMSPRVSASGELPNPMANYLEWEKEQAKSTMRTKNIASITSNWTCLGPTSVPAANSGQHGAGRLNCVAVNPLNANVIYVGAPAGGLWKSTNGGTSWTALAQNLASIGITDIAINPTDTSMIFIATGDKDASDTYSAGVMKSTDGGLTFATTGLNWGVNLTRNIARLIINPDSANIMLAATTIGIVRTINGGATWTTSLSIGGIYDMEFKPSHPRTVYACSGTHVYRSVNGGTTFTALSTGLPTTGTTRMQLAVTANDTNYVYVLAAATDNSYYGLYRSTDGGTTFTTMSSTPNILGFSTNGSSTGGQGWYDLALAVSPTAKNTVYVGGINVFRSTNGGSSWTCVGQGYNNVTSSSHVHPDVHNLYFSPGSGTVIYCASDGGLFKCINATATNPAWTDVSSGLQIMEFYRISCAQTSTTICIGGAQDNGCNKYSAGTWTSIAAGDGMGTAIDFTNANTMYEEGPYGDLSISTNGGGNWGSIPPTSNGAWVTPFVIDPNSNTTLYAGYTELYKTSNQGNSWTQITSNLTGGTNLIEAITVAPSNSNYLYVGAGPVTSGPSACTALYKSINGGTTWTTITGTLPLGGAPLTYIAVKNNDPNTVFVTLSGYINGNKVFKTTNGGTTWTNVSGNLPNVPVNCIVYVPNTPNAIYVGTDIGVYYTDDVLGSWVPFNTNLPNVVVFDLQIQRTGSLLRAGTYGRGLWSTPMYITTDIPEVAANSTVEKIFPNPTTGELTINLPTNGPVTIEIFNVLGEKINNLPIESKIPNQYTINLSAQPKGIYLIRTTTNESVATEKVVLTK
ncbi:MAG: T9SS type A sorting domain-containing protein [Bacteroidota bacterium]